MPLFDRLREGLFKVRVVPKQQPEDLTTYAKDGKTLPEELNKALEAGKRLDLTQLQKITTLSGNRNAKYDIFEEMLTDGRISAAMEIYANDSVQYNSQGKVVWAEADNEDVSKYVNKLIQDLQIPANLWSWAYCLCLYGDVYIETFVNTSSSGQKPTLLLEPLSQGKNIRTQKKIQGSKLERYIEKVPNAADIYDLQYKGKTSGFVKSESEIPNNQENNIYTYETNIDKINILSPTKYVHICLSPNINRFPEKFKLIQEDNKEKTTPSGDIDGSDSEGAGAGSLTFTVKSGQSVLENVYSAWQTLKLKEDSVLLERLTKSSITRVIQVELGDLPESQKRKKLNELKQQIEQQINLNKSSGTIESRAGCQPTENIIYTTTKNGKGAISTVNIGGDSEIGNTEDIEDSENELYGALMIPKAYLGGDMDGTGLSNGGSLTEMNATYARRIKRIQMALCEGITTIVNIFALGDDIGKKVIGNFDIKLTPIITVEDNRRDELLQNKIRNVNDMLSLVEKMEDISDETKTNIILTWLNSYLNQQDIVDLINKQLKENEVKENEAITDEAEDNMSNNIDSNFSSSFGSDLDLDFNEELEEPMHEEPELAEQEDLSEIEGEDLL